MLHDTVTSSSQSVLSGSGLCGAIQAHSRRGNVPGFRNRISALAVLQTAQHKCTGENEAETFSGVFSETPV